MLLSWIDRTSILYVRVYSYDSMYWGNELHGPGANNLEDVIKANGDSFLSEHLSHGGALPFIRSTQKTWGGRKYVLYFLYYFRLLLIVRVVVVLDSYYHSACPSINRGRSWRGSEFIQRKGWRLDGTVSTTTTAAVSRSVANVLCSNWVPRASRTKSRTFFFILSCFFPFLSGMTNKARYYTIKYIYTMYVLYILYIHTEQYCTYMDSSANI